MHTSSPLGGEEVCMKFEVLLMAAKLRFASHQWTYKGIISAVSEAPTFGRHSRDSNLCGPRQPSDARLTGVECM